MKKSQRVGKIFLSMLINPFFMTTYFITLYTLISLCEVGGKDKKIPVILVGGILLLLWFIVFIIRAIKEPKQIKEDNDNQYNWNKKKVVWSKIAIVILIVTTIFFGYKIYYSGTKYNGKLAWYLEDLFNKKDIELQHNNIYKNGFEGILKDISQEIELPKKLYVTNTINIKFSKDGTINYIYAFIYGKNKDGELESFLIDYDSSKSKNMSIRMNGYINGTFSDDKLLKPFINTLKVMKLKSLLYNPSLKDSDYELSYSGVKSIGYNNDHLMYVDYSGNLRGSTKVKSEIIGYIVSLSFVNNEESNVEYRYKLVDDLDNIEGEDYEGTNTIKDDIKEEKEISKSRLLDDGTLEYYRSKKIGYHLEVIGAAAGSREYSLYKTIDAGKSWDMLNENPFLGEMGQASEITFIDDNLGFISLSKSGGSYAKLFRTDNGGMSYTEISIPAVNVPLNDMESYNPFDYPSMPYERDGALYMKVKQGSDGDYNGNSVALYKSYDRGVTWTYEKEINGEYS